MNRRMMVSAFGFSICGAVLPAYCQPPSEEIARNKKSGTTKMNSQELTRLVTAATRAAAADLVGQYGRNALLGFALCTDDDVRTLYHVACTKQWAKDNGDPDVGYLYTEWTLSAKSGAFKSLGHEMDSLADIKYPTDAEWENARDERFEALARGLLECRQDGVFDATTFLCVGSTDPSSHMKQLAVHAVERLNPAEIAEKAKRAW